MSESANVSSVSLRQSFNLAMIRNVPAYVKYAAIAVVSLVVGMLLASELTNGDWDHVPLPGETVAVQSYPSAPAVSE